MIPSSDIATRPCSSDLLTTDFPEIFSQLWLSSEACTKYYPLERGRVGAATVEPPWAVCVLGRVSRSPQANATSKLAVWGRIQHKQAVSACWLSHRWALNKAQCGCPSRPCNAVFPCMYLCEPPSLQWCPECVSTSKTVCGSFKGASGISVSFHLTWVTRISTDFYY